MFFFGSISTFIPYLIYISVVWICVLIGFRGNFFSNLITSNEIKNLVTAESEEKSTNENCYILSYREKGDADSQDKSVCSNNYHSLFHLKKITLNYQKLPDRKYQASIISGNLLRGPPYHSV